MKKIKQWFRVMKSKMTGSVQAAYVSGMAFMLVAAGSAQASDPFGSAAIQGEAESIVEFILNLLNGWVGYLLALVAFFAGIFNYFKNRDLWGTMGAFGLAIMIMIVPPVLQGFFAGAA